jgi:spore photoproduct lyase
MIDEYETGSASLIQRLESAKKCSQLGYKIAFHLDPIIPYEKWEKDYCDLIDSIFKYVKPSDIVWISVACFRYTQNLKNIILERFPKTKLFLGEMIRCEDGKYRYIRHIRVNIYRKIIAQIKRHGENIPIYFCMESPSVWMDVFGKLPHKIENLKGIFC